MELVFEMTWSIKYRKNLSQRIFSELQDLELKPVKLQRLCESLRAGLKEWKKNDNKKEESSFEIFMRYMNIDTEALSDNPGRDKESIRFQQRLPLQI